MWTSKNCGRYDRGRLRYPSDLTDEEWALVEPLIPPAKRGGNRRHVVVREVVNGLMYILSTGCQWRAIPMDLPPRSTLYDYFDLLELGRHARSHPRRALCAMPGGRLARGESDRRDHRQPERQECGKRGPAIDSSGYDAGKKIKGKKRHILVDTQGLLMHAIVHAADVQDRDGGALVMASLFGGVRLDQALCRRRLPGAGVPERDQTDFGAPQRRDRQAVGSSHTLRRAPKALDRRTHIRLARPLPTTGQGLGMPQPQGARLPPPRFNPSHAAKTMQSRNGRRLKRMLE